jgi:hypothetical protein
LTLALLVATADPAPSHEAANPLFKQLLELGVEVGPDLRTKLPPPTMADGLDGAKQTAAIKALLGTDISYDEFTRRSVVAPQLLRLRDAKPSDPKAPARGVDVWFVAYGDFKKTEDDAFLERLLKAGRGEGGAEGEGKALTADDLAKRKITLSPELGKRQSFGHVTFDFLDKVRIHATGQGVTSRTAESVVAAVELDPRFVGDKEFPNEWQPLTKEPGGVKVGPAQPYTGSGLYLKVTKLAEPAGAIFLEQHVVFAEPVGWFEGLNLLRSKLPQAVQIQVRNVRREWLKPGAGK